jgi:amidase
VPNVQKIAPCLWFDDQAEAAAGFYTAIFKHSRIVRVTRYGVRTPDHENEFNELRLRSTSDWSEPMRMLNGLRCVLMALVFVGIGGSEFPAAQSRPIVAETYYNTFSHSHPVLSRIRPGDTVSTRTLDASGRDLAGTVRARPPNPLTGPFYVEGAEPGDALAVRFTRVRMNRNWGWSNYRLGLYSLLPESIEGLYPNRYKPNEIIADRVSVVPWDLDLDRQIVRLREPTSGVQKMEFPAKPMLGCVGVAPAGDFAPTSSPAGSYGGNLDYNEIGEGTTVILPVYHPGALLFIGDGHALQADGEPTGTGIETSMDVEFTVQLRKNVNLAGPRAETAEHIISIGSQPEFVSSMNRALEMATSDMVNWLTAEYKLEPWAAHLLIGYQGRYDIVTVAGSVALKIPKNVLPQARVAAVGRERF